MNHKRLCSLIAVSVLTGCISTTQNQPSEVEDKDDVAVVVPRFTRETISNGDFEYDFNPDLDKCAFRILREGVTITDLANFARHDCWDKRLKAKIESGAPLTDNDVKLADFCWKTELMVVDTLTFAMLNDMTKNDAVMTAYVESHPEVINADFKEANAVDAAEAQAEAVYTQLKLQFLRSEASPLRRSIRKWGAQFACAEIPAETWLYTYQMVYDNRSSLTSQAIDKNHKKWLWMPQVANGKAPKRSSFGKSELKKFAALLDKSSDRAGERWQIMRQMTNKYLEDLNNMNTLLDGYTRSKKGSADAHSIDLIQNVFEKHGEDTLSYNRYYKRALYDMPLVAYSHRACAEIYASKGFFNDDEELMMDAARRYETSIRGIDMVRNAHSMYAYAAYTGVIEALKDELDDEEFKTLCTQTKLYKVDVADDPMVSNECTRGTDKKSF